MFECGKKKHFKDGVDRSFKVVPSTITMVQPPQTTLVMMEFMQLYFFQSILQPYLILEASRAMKVDLKREREREGERTFRHRRPFVPLCRTGSVSSHRFVTCVETDIQCVETDMRCDKTDYLLNFF